MGRATIPKVLKMTQSTPEETDFPVLPRLSHLRSIRSMVKKPRGKATDPYINVTGSLTLLLQLLRKTDRHVAARDED